MSPELRIPVPGIPLTVHAVPVVSGATVNGLAPDSVKRLVETFDRNLASYHTPACSETQLRRDYLDPFFDVLGWDVANWSRSAVQPRTVPATPVYRGSFLSKNA